MSGYRNIHRQDLNCDANTIWSVTCSPLLCRGNKHGWRFWTAGGNGKIKGYVVHEKTLQESTNTTLDASACFVRQTHELLVVGGGENHNSKKSIGCSTVQVTRNYVGQDTHAGDLVVASMALNGAVNVWVLPENMDDDDGDDDDDTTTLLPAQHSFTVPNATGTCLQICPPNVSHMQHNTIVLAVPCLDGSIAVVSSGVAIYNPKQENAAGGGVDISATGGTILSTFSSKSNASSSNNIALSCAWHPHKFELAVGRKDGMVQVLLSSHTTKSHRMIQHEACVRSVAYTPDGHLLCSASDDAMICIWDVSRGNNTTPTLVNHALLNNNHWIFSMTPLWDSRRFVSCTSEKLQVWTCESDMDANGEVHSFAVDKDSSDENNNSSIWISADACMTQFKSQASAAAPTPVPRMVSITERGKLQIYTLEA